MMGNIVFVIYRPARQVLAAGMRTTVTGGGGTGAVDSVNGQTGVVVLTATDVGADTAGTAAAAVAAHTALADPHPQYLTPAEANVAYERVLTAGTNVTIDRTNPSAPVINASGGGGGGAVDSVNGQTGVVVLDAADVGADVAGAATAAVAAHTAASDPHTQYLTPAEASSAYAPLAHIGSGGAAHANAIAAGAAGFMTGADKTKLDGVAAGATQNSADATLLARANHTGTQTASTISDFASASRAQTEAELVAGANITITPSGSGATRQLTVAATGGGGGGSTNLSTTTSTTTLTVNSDTGTDAVLPAATPSVAGVLTGADKTKLDGIAAGATQNSSDAFLRARGNHTGTQTASTISDFTEATQDVVGSSVVAGANVTVTYDDDTGLTTVAATGGGMANPMTTAGDMIVGGAAGVPARLPVGATGKVLGVASGAPAWVDPPAAAGGLVNFTEAKNSASPNATVPVVQLAVSVSEANGDASVTPKGTGAFTLHVPDGATAGGAKRGSYSVDLSLARTNSVQVASGAYSAVLGGEALRASANYSVSLGGRSNTASGTHSAALAGDTCTASGQYAVTLGGQSNTASGTHSACLGGSSLTVSGTYAVGSGLGCVANGVSSYAQGAYASARQVQGSFAFSAGRFGTTGDAQTMSLQLRQQTSNATTVRLTSNAAAAAAANQMVLPSSAAFGYRGQVVAIDTAGNTSAWRIDGLAKSNSGGTVSLVGTPSVSLIAQDASAASWAVAVAVDSTNRCLAVDVTGAASTTIRWLCNLETVQLVF